MSIQIRVIVITSFLMAVGYCAPAGFSETLCTGYAPETLELLQKLSRYAPWRYISEHKVFQSTREDMFFRYLPSTTLALESACEGDVKSLAFALLKNPACRNYCDEWGNHPLLAALDRCRANRPCCPVNDYKACVYLLLACGADPNVAWYGIPLIFKAVQLVTVDLVAALLKAGANATVLDRYGKSIFSWLRQRRFADGPPQPLADDEVHDRDIKLLLEQEFIFRLQAAQKEDNHQEFARLRTVLVKDKELFGYELRKTMIWHEEEQRKI